MTKKLLKDSIGLFKVGMVTAYGSQMISEAGGDASGLAKIGKYSGTIGNVMGMNAVLGSIKKIGKK